MKGSDLWLKTLGGVGASAMAVAGYRARLSILIFHSVSPAPTVLGYSDSTATVFDRIVRTVASAFNVITLSEAVEHLEQGSLPPRALCITFDDGYADNYTVALPILRRHDVSATFFIASSFIDGGIMFNDAVREAVRRCEHERLDLSALDLGVHELVNIEQKRAAIRHLLDKVKPLALEQREDTVAAIARAAGVTLQSNLMMTREQLLGLAAAGMDIGAHTHRHPILSSLSDQEVADELSSSKSELEALVDRPVRLFAYPNGRPGVDYELRHAKMVSDAGFDAAVSTARGAATYGADVYQLPRFTPWARKPEQFIAQLMLNWRNEYSLAG